ncbi:MAG: hypothetical protein ACTSRZ_17085 [Promethearchaeota archaeon]
MGFFTYPYQWLSYGASIISGILSIIIFFMFQKKKNEKNSPIITKIQYSILFLSFAALIDSIFFTINGINPAWREVFDYVTLGSYLSFCCSAISNVLLFMFVKDIFGDSINNIFYKIIIAIQSAAVPLFIITFFIGWASSDRAFIVLIMHVLVSFIIYINLSWNALKLRRFLQFDAIEDIYRYKGLLYIALAGILMFSALVLFISHEIIIAFSIKEYYTVTFGWLTGVIASYFVFLGYIMPDWLKQRWKSSAEKILEMKNLK